MIKYLNKFLLSLLSILLSAGMLFITSEAVLRVLQKGLIEGFKSFFITEPPHSVLGVSDWVISDDELGYRLNPRRPGINALSMREGEIKLPKPLNTKRIVILGDSIPYTGKPTFVDILKDYFKNNNQVEVFNASTPGYTNYQELLFLEKYLLPIQPDIVLLSYVPNDNHKFLHVFDQNANMLFTKEAEESLALHNIFDVIISKSYGLTWLKAMFIKKQDDVHKSASKYWWGDSPDFNTSWKDESWDSVTRQIEKMWSVLNKNNARLLIVSFPLEDQLRLFSANTNDLYILKPQTKIAFISEKRDIPYLDLFPAFYKKYVGKGTQLYTDGLHLTTFGHAVAAEEILAFLNHYMY